MFTCNMPQHVAREHLATIKHALKLMGLMGLGIRDIELRLNVSVAKYPNLLKVRFDNRYYSTAYAITSIDFSVFL